MSPNEIYVVLRFGQTYTGAIQGFTSQTYFPRNTLDIAFQAPATVAVILPERSKLQLLLKDQQPEPVKYVHVNPPLLILG